MHTGMLNVELRCRSSTGVLELGTKPLTVHGTGTGTPSRDIVTSYLFVY